MFPCVHIFLTEKTAKCYQTVFENLEKFSNQKFNPEVSLKLLFLSFNFLPNKYFIYFKDNCIRL